MHAQIRTGTSPLSRPLWCSFHQDERHDSMTNGERGEMSEEVFKYTPKSQLPPNQRPTVELGHLAQIQPLLIGVNTDR